MTDFRAQALHIVILLAVIAATTYLAAVHVVSGTAAVELLALAGGLGGGALASSIGGALALRDPNTGAQPDQPALPPAPAPAAGNG